MSNQIGKSWSGIGVMVGAVFFATVLATIGCSSKKPTASAAKKGPSKSPSTSLPKLDEYLPPLDDGRVEAAPPAGWQLLPRSSKYLFAARTAKGPYPLVRLVVEDYPDQSIRFLTKDNIKQFATARAKQLGKSPDKVKIVEEGNFLGIVYASRGQIRGTVSQIVHILRLETVVDGRLYRVELQTEPGQLAQYQPYAFAVAAGLRFPKAQPPEQLIATQQEQLPQTEQAPATQAGKSQPTVTAKTEATEKPQPEAVTKAAPETTAKAEPKPAKKPAEAEETISGGLNLDELESLLKDD